MSVNVYVSLYVFLGKLTLMKMNLNSSDFYRFHIPIHIVTQPYKQHMHVYIHIHIDSHVHAHIFTCLFTNTNTYTRAKTRTSKLKRHFISSHT